MQLKPFIEIIRRIAKSKYPVLLMHNRMIMQCYTVEIDEDVGMHYVLHIPETEEYSDPFYDRTILLAHGPIMEAYKEGHENLLKVKKEKNAKPKEVREELDVVQDKNEITLKMQFIVRDELVCTMNYITTVPVESDPEVERILNAYSKMLSIIKIGGYGIALDAIRHGLYDRALNTPRIVYYPIRIGSTKVRIPICKSMIGTGACDECFVSVQETTISDIYIYTLQLEKKKLIEQWIGYIIAF